MLVSYVFRNGLHNSALGLVQLCALGRLNNFRFQVSQFHILGILKTVVTGTCLESNSDGVCPLVTVKIGDFE